MVILRNEAHPRDESILFRLRSRKSHNIVSYLEQGIQEFSWQERWRGPGTATLMLDANSVPDDVLAHLAGGDGGFECRRIWHDRHGDQHVDQFFGYTVRLRVIDSTAFVYSHDTSAVSNEIIVLGEGDGAAREVTRVHSLTSQALYGVREQTLDKRQLLTAAERQEWGNAKLIETIAPATQLSVEPQRSQSSRAQRPRIQVELKDALGYLDDRVTDAQGVGVILGGEMAAADYIEALLNRELLTPTLARRTVDSVIALLAAAGPGNNVTLPVRWERLTTAIRYACALGHVGIVYAYDQEAHRITYQVRPINDRTTGRERAILSRPFADQEFDIRPGDLVEGAIWLGEDAKRPAIGPVNTLCVSRQVQIRPGQETIVAPEFGAEAIGLGRLFAAIDERARASQSV